MKKLIIGFTILEIAVSISLFSIAILLTGSMYIISQRTYNKGRDQGELIQNVRVVFDRITRELRQSVEMVTDLPDSEGSAIAEILFQAGHDTDQITYLKYNLEGTNLKRYHIAYEFSSELGTYVTYDSTEGGLTPNVRTLSGKVIGEYFADLNFWESEGLVNYSVSLEKGQETIDISSMVTSRN